MLKFLLVMIIIAAIVFVPFIGIWAVNTLFALNIAFTFVNWAAMFVLMLMFGASSKR